MVKFHEDAYWLHNLSLFAFNIRGPWDQINKIMRENRRPVLLSISLEYLEIFCSLQGVLKMVPIPTFFPECLKLTRSQYKAYQNFRHRRKKCQIWTIFGTPCNEQNISRYSKDIDNNTWGLFSIIILSIWCQGPSILKAKSDKLLSQYASS